MIKCAICGRTFSRITTAHTQAAHNLTLEQYREQYGATTKNESTALVSTPDGPLSLFEAAARGMSPDEMNDLQANSRLRIFSNRS